MVRVLLLLLLVGCAPAGPPPAPPQPTASAWPVFEPAGAGFRVLMPGTPSVTGRTAALGPLQVSWRDLGPLDRNKSLERIQGDEMRKVGTVTRTSGTYANGRPALEGTVTTADGKTRTMRVFHHQYRLYILSAQGPDAQRFLDSFDLSSGP